MRSPLRGPVGKDRKQYSGPAARNRARVFLRPFHSASGRFFETLGRTSDSATRGHITLSGSTTNLILVSHPGGGICLETPAGRGLVGGPLLKC